MSTEAIRRIGPVPSLSLLPANPPRRAEEPQTYAGRDGNRAVPTTNVYSTMPVSQPTGSQNRSDALGRADEFGSKPTNNIVKSLLSGDEAGGSTARPGAGRQVPQDTARRPAENATGAVATAKANRVWPSAEDEKQRLYEEAKSRVERTQTGGAVSAPARASPPVCAVVRLVWHLPNKLVSACSCDHSSTGGCSSCQPLANCGGRKVTVIQRGAGSCEADPRTRIL